MQETILVMGFPASGKSSLSDEYIAKGYVHLNRDKAGGRVRDLLPAFEQALKDGKNCVLDNLFATIEGRKPFLEMAKRYGIPVTCLWMGTSIEDAQLNSLNRMWERYGTIFMNADAIKAHDAAKKDSNMFPPVVLFAFKKRLEKPTTDEGFAKVVKVKFERKPSSRPNSA